MKNSMGANGNYQLEFVYVNKSSILIYAFNRGLHGNLNFHDPVSSSRDIDQNRGANLI